MPNNQYLISISIMVLVIVLVVLAAFDYRNDTRTFRERRDIYSNQQGLGPRLPSRLCWGLDAQGRYLCPGCGWRGTSLLKGRCPTCSFCPAYRKINRPVSNLRDSVPLNSSLYSLCPACGWRGSHLSNFRCPNCLYYLGGQFASKENAALGVPAAWQRARPPGRLSLSNSGLFCPGCDFSMPGQYRIAPNSVKCPRCNAFLFASETSQGMFYSGQPIAYTPPPYGTGMGYGLNPFCPNR